MDAVRARMQNAQIKFFISFVPLLMEFWWSGNKKPRTEFCFDPGISLFDPPDPDARLATGLVILVPRQVF